MGGWGGFAPGQMDGECCAKTVAALVCAGARGNRRIARNLPGVLILIVTVDLLLLISPPHCPRTRPKDAKTRPPRPGLDRPFVGSSEGEKGSSNPRYTLQSRTVFSTGRHWVTLQFHRSKALYCQ